MRSKEEEKAALMHDIVSAAIQLLQTYNAHLSIDARRTRMIRIGNDLIRTANEDAEND